MNLGTRTLLRGDRLIHIAAGGAGYGDPLERPVGMVAEDLADGILDADFAREVYGVVLDASGGVDDPATRRARAELALQTPEARASAQRRRFLLSLGAGDLLPLDAPDAP